MKLYFEFWGLLLIAVCISSKELRNKFSLPRNLKLQMVNAVFRHGDRTPQPIYGETYPNDPFANMTYSPLGYGAMTNIGKLRAFRLGTFLRRRYNKFLGTTYIPEDITSISTYVDRAKITLLAVLAALYPPNSVQKWHPTLNWQPIPILFEKVEDDFLLYSRRCPKYTKMWKEVEESEEIKQRLGEFKSLTNELTKLTGKNITNLSDIFSLSNLLSCQQSMKLPIPKWGKELLMNNEFQEAVHITEKVMNYNDTMKQIIGGPLLKQMTNDMLAKKNGTLREGKKMKLYSAHDVNVYVQLYALGIEKFESPFYCSAVILELYSDKEGNYYVQILYYKGDTSKVEILEIPDCTSMCELNKYQELIKNVIPIDANAECCGSEHCTLKESSTFMKIYFKFWGLLLIAVCISSRELKNKFALPRNLKLQMVNAVFRHGDRTPNPLYSETYPNDRFVNETYYPIGFGALTKVGKLRAYKLGKFLRRRYNTFLGTTYIPEDITPRSTHIDRAKMTLLLVLAALYPPNSIQKWHPTLKWQPIPIDYQKIDDDILLFSRRCPKYKEMFSEIEKLEEVKEMFGEFKSLTRKLTELTGKDITTPTDVFSFYNLLICQKSMKLPIPNWAEELLANNEFLEAVEVLEKLRNYNDTMKKMNGGRLLKQMTTDMIAKQSEKLKEGKKIKLYSAHDVNVYGQLYALGISKFESPFYCSAVILELYSDNEDNYYVQILYYQGETSKVEILKIPNCTSMCELRKYQELLKKVIPGEDELECCDNELEYCSLQETSFF
ncbi:uncharacterized protein LOC122506046 [Leptopilina heterotoma]|uniref:uncharacterized protein LOC122506046 n=1 Tax=Leptopilina heterotoma TaxID=63436 RepID=UPI001CA9BFEC|nr:uncharacterized protein LOC122506046 [Leptopilina heterotoma]